MLNAHASLAAYNLLLRSGVPLYCQLPDLWHPTISILVHRRHLSFEWLSPRRFASHDHSELSNSQQASLHNPPKPQYSLE